MMEKEARSSSLLRGESHVSKTCGACVSSRTGLGVLVILNIIFIVALAVTMYLVFDLKQQVKELQSGKLYGSRASHSFISSTQTNGSGETSKKLSQLKPTPDSGRPVKPSKSLWTNGEDGRSDNRDRLRTTSQSVRRAYL